MTRRHVVESPAYRQAQPSRFRDRVLVLQAAEQLTRPKVGEPRRWQLHLMPRAKTNRNDNCRVGNANYCRDQVLACACTSHLR